MISPMNSLLRWLSVLGLVLAGGFLSLLVGCFLVRPLWVAFRYQPTTITVLEKRLVWYKPRLSSRSSFTSYYLRAHVEYQARGRQYQTWVTVPGRYRDKPDAEAALQRLGAGEELTGYYYVLDPSELEM